MISSTPSILNSGDLANGIEYGVSLKQALTTISQSLSKLSNGIATNTKKKASEPVITPFTNCENQVPMRRGSCGLRKRGKSKATLYMRSVSQVSILFVGVYGWDWKVSTERKIQSTQGIPVL